MHKKFAKLAICLCGLSVILGAFAAHALKSKLSDHALSVFETGVRYQFYHGLALLVVAFYFEKLHQVWAIRTCNFFVCGVILFSGSLYLLSLVMPFYSVIGMITPIGGLCFILGWASLLFAIKNSENN